MRQPPQSKAFLEGKFLGTMSTVNWLLSDKVEYDKVLIIKGLVQASRILAELKARK